MRLLLTALILLVRASCFAQTPGPAETPQSAEEVHKVSTLLQQGNPQVAVREALSAIQITKREDARILTLASVGSAQMGDAQEALGYAQRALRQNPNYLPALEITAQMLFQKNDARAETYARRILIERPEDENANAIMADLSLRKHQCTDEVRYAAYAERVIFSDSARVLAHARCQAESGQQTAAIGTLKRGLQSDPNSTPLRFDLASMLAREKQTDEALETLYALVDSEKPETEVLVLQAKLLVSQSNLPQALATLKRAIGLHPRDQYLYVDAATLLYEANAVSQGIEMLSQGIEENAGASELYLTRAILYGAVNDTSRCLSDLNEAGKGNTHLDSLVVRGLLEEQANNLDRAVELYGEAVRLFPSSSLNHFLLAESLGRRSDDPISKSRALREAKVAVRLSPRSATARVLLARLEFGSGKVEDSERDCESALGLEPENQGALYQLLMIKRKIGSRTEIAEIVSRLMTAKAKDAASSPAQEGDL